MDADKRRLVTDPRHVGLPYVTARLTFLSPEEGGRKRPFGDGFLANLPSPHPSRGYMPHLVIEDHHFTRGTPAPKAQHDCPRKLYMGVKFIDGPERTPTWEPMVFTLMLMYHPQVDYSSLTPGTRVAVREGGTTVGFGEILSRGEHVGNLLRPDPA